MPYLYIKDAVRAFLELRDTPDKRLSRRFYGIQGFSAPAAELVKAIKKQIPQAQLDYKPDAQVAKVIGILHGVDDSMAREDWSWKPGYDIDGLVKDFITEFRAHPELYSNK